MQKYFDSKNNQKNLNTLQLNNNNNSTSQSKLMTLS
jgi:hypothetical protein